MKHGINKLCERCARDCKQTDRVIVAQCPPFTPKAQRISGVAKPENTEHKEAV